MLETPTVAALGPPTPAAPVPDLPHVRPGSHFDAKQLRSKLQALLGELDRAHDHLAMLLDLAQERKIFLMLEGPDGQYFRDWTAFVTAPQPWGLGMGEALIAALVKEQRDPQRRARLALQSAVVIGHRGPRTRQEGPAPAAQLAANQRGTAYKLARLKRDHPEVLERLARGELPSIAAAWEAAGFQVAHLKVMLDPMNVARVIVTRFDAAQQREIVDLVTHPERITAPPHGPQSAGWRAFDAARTTPEERAQREAERAARRVAARAAIDARRREEYAAAMREKRAQAHALELPAMAAGAEAAG